MERLYAQGAVVGHRYQIVERLGAGGMGVVFVAHDRLTGHSAPTAAREAATLSGK